MRIAGIIAEYDPFHKGHATHIAATPANDGGQATHIVAVMSGNFTQRGEPALLNKYLRAEMALRGGVDLVIELPIPWAMAPAEHFARGGVALLNALGCVDFISFGSECGDIELLNQLADISSDPQFQENLQNYLSQGIPYAAAAQSAATELFGEKASAIASPNNTLGIEYLRAIKYFDSNMGAYTLLRNGAAHNENKPIRGVASASYIRSLLCEGLYEQSYDYLPIGVRDILSDAIAQEKAPIIKERLEQCVPAILRRMSEEDFKLLPWLSEGLENRLYKASRTVGTYEELIDAVKTKRYPASRLRRIIWSAVLGLTADRICDTLPYIRVLAMNSRGQEILSKASPTLPILTRTSQLERLSPSAQNVFHTECIATDLHSLGAPTPTPCGMDYTAKLIKI